MSVSNESLLHSFPPMSTKEIHDIKRVRGQISCAECRRLKLKCDKKIPCSSCVRRGCKSVCPTETTLPQEKRSSGTAGLRKQIEAMTQRIQELENALSTVRASIASKIHTSTLDENQISPELKSLTSERVELHEDIRPTIGALGNLDTVDVLGTLALDERGDARYLGPSAGLESLLEDGPVQDTEESGDEDYYFPVASEGIAQLPKYFNLTSDSSWDVGSSLDLILSYLPPRERAFTLAEIFIERSLLQIKAVSRQELFDELLTPVYQYASTMDFASQECPLSPTHLAVLFICLAHGSLADIDTPTYSAESENYLKLSRISLALHPVLSSPDLASVQALTLIGMFHDTGGRSYNIEAAWSFLTVASKLSQSLGLHRESPRWGLDKKTLYRRRTVFWEIITWDAMLSLSLGRPPCFFGAHIDTPLPFDEDASVDEHGNTEPGFHHWRMSFSKDVVTAVSNITLSSGMPDYTTILDLDRCVREHPLPKRYDPLRFLYSALENKSLNALNVRKEVVHETSSMILKGHHLTHLKALVTMFIHRAFFAQALLHSPSDPLGSVYAPSFLATYRAASILVHLNVKHFYKYFDILSRFWALWNGVLTAGIILGLIVSRCPQSTLAANAYEELGLAVDLFKLGATHSDRAKRGLHVLLQTHTKATKAYKDQNNSAREKLNMAQEDAEAIHILEVFAGYTKLLMKDMSSNPKAYANEDYGLPPVFQSHSQSQRDTLTTSTSPGAFSPTAFGYRSDGKEADSPHHASDFKYSYPVIPFSTADEATDQISQSHRVQYADHQYPEQARHEHNYASSSFNTPNIYPFPTYESNSSGITSQIAYEMNPCPASQNSQYWTGSRSRYDISVYPVLEHEEDVGYSNIWPSIAPGSQSWPQRSAGGIVTSHHPEGQPPLTMAVGAMNVQWAELMRDEGVPFSAAEARVDPISR